MRSKAEACPSKPASNEEVRVLMKRVFVALVLVVNLLMAGAPSDAQRIEEATAESTGLPTERSDGTWLMCPGSPGAHIRVGDIPYGQDEELWKTCGA